MERAVIEESELRLQVGGGGQGAVAASPDRIFLTWLPYSSRSQTLAESFGAEAVYFGYLAGQGNFFKTVLRYVLMTFHTVGFILRRNPRLVFVMNQPVFLPLALFLLSHVSRIKYIIDSHSGLFNKPQWNWSLPLVKYAYRHSLFSIVTNRRHRDLVESWGAKAEILGALSVGEEPAEPFARPAGPCLVVIGTFAHDEPTAEVIEACRRLPEVRFFVTGALKNAPQQLLDSAPDNVIFTDFLSRPKYVGLVQAMDGAIILVKNDHVMQRGAYEAASWAVPIITSDWPVLRENFTRGAIFVDNSPEDIVSAVRELLSRLGEYKAEIAELQRERREVWDETMVRINAFIAENIAGGPVRRMRG